MQSLLDGCDTLVVMPTGGGKSAIYQLAALLLDGPAVIVSPLIVTPFAVVDVVRLPSSPQATHVRARAQSGAVHFMRAR